MRAIDMRAGGLVPASVPRCHRPRYEGGGAVDSAGDNGGLGAFVGGDWSSPGSIALGGIGDAYHALFGPDDMGSMQVGTPVSPGGIGDAYRALYGNFSPAPSADDIAPGGIGDAYKALMVPGTGTVPEPASTDSFGDGPGTYNIDEELAQAQPPSPLLSHPICIEAFKLCMSHMFPGLPPSMRLAAEAACADGASDCNNNVQKALARPGNVIYHTTFADGTAVVIPGDGRPPYFLQRDH